MRFLTCYALSVLAASALAAEKPTRQCGGSAGIGCPPEMVCIDNPDDDCNPMTDGPDCAGICAPMTPVPEVFGPMFPTILTVYSGGHAYIEVRHAITLAAGISTVFLEVAPTAVPDSIVFMPLEPGAVLLRDQRYTPRRRFDAASIFREHIGDTVRITGFGSAPHPNIEGILLNADGPLVVSTKNGIEIVRNYRHIQLVGALLPNSKAKSGVHLDLFTDKGGKFDTRLFYEAGGIGWKAYYNAILGDAPALAELSEEKGRYLRMDFRGQAAITNNSDMSYGHATIRLVAGDVRRRAGQRKIMSMGVPDLMLAGGKGGGFEQKAFFEHHLYTLGRRMSLPKQSSVQTALFPVVRDMAAEKVLVFNASPRHVSPYPVVRPNTAGRGDVDVSLRFKNTSEHPWPAGTIRFSKMDYDELGTAGKTRMTLVFVGEGAIGHTPVGRSVSIPIGTAFDVKAERKQTSFNVKRSGSRNQIVEITEAFETTIHNHKDTVVTVHVRETMWRWLTHYEFSIDSIKQEYKHTADPANRTVEIELRIPPNGRATVKYDIRYYR